ncbi:hypothetical protein MES4922_10044 [Mesorhizobium ventifaucium]|uniref:Uncharacterized protein n=1 Tax=Mesorhizobium ventifaucium TaxID=666020 RepID=A0ABM9DC78_9HYPH|nr:hypothetical protein MES4922_10044 [Mesorhizobium ventifaucium]
MTANGRESAVCLARVAAKSGIGFEAQGPEAEAFRASVDPVSATFPNLRVMPLGIQRAVASRHQGYPVRTPK